MMRVRSTESRQSERGISLIEMAIALIVIGLIIGPLIQMYNLDLYKRERDSNIKKLELVNESLNRFARMNGRLPFPARPDLNETSANYGKQAAPTSRACTTFVAAGLKCKPGVKDTNDGDTSGSVGPFTGDTVIDEVVFGSVPYKDLNLSVEDSLDIFGSKLTYVVSKQSLYTNSFNNSHGAIRLINQLNADFDGGADRKVVNGSKLQGLLFLVLSHGKDRSGAYLRDGTLTPCGSTGLDVTNCNQSTLAAQTTTLRAMQEYNRNDPTLVIANQSDYTIFADSAQHFDDMARFSTTTADTFWTMNMNGTREDMYSRDNTNANVAIGTTAYGPSNNGTLPDRVYVAGGVRSAAQTRSTLLCGTGSTACFSTANIADVPPAITTDSMQPVYCNIGQPLLKVKPRGGGDYSAQRQCIQKSEVRALGPASSYVNCPNGYKGYNGTTVICAP